MENIEEGRGDYIVYKEGYKYQLQSSCVIQTQIRCQAADDISIKCPFVTLYHDGTLWIDAGYAWDGPTGVPDHREGMRASLAHDSLYQLMRLGLLGHEWKGSADQLFYEMLLEDGMHHWMALIWYEGVKKLAGFATRASADRKLLVAPRQDKKLGGLPHD